MVVEHEDNDTINTSQRQYVDKLVSEVAMNIFPLNFAI